MNFLDYDIDTSKLFTKAELLDFLEENGGSDRALSKVRERYMVDFGNELVWYYPISDGKHKGTFIVFVQEGFISIPYDIVDAIDHEILELQQTAMFDDEAMQYFIDDWISFSDNLTSAMKDMHRILSEKK